MRAMSTMALCFIGLAGCREAASTPPQPRAQAAAYSRAAPVEGEEDERRTDEARDDLFHEDDLDDEASNGGLYDAFELHDPIARVDQKEREARWADVEYEAWRLRRATRQLDDTAQRFSDGQSDWADVMPQMSDDLDQAERRAKYLEWSLEPGAEPDVEYDVARTRRELRELRWELEAAQSTGEDWDGFATEAQESTDRVSRYGRRIEDEVDAADPD